MRCIPIRLGRALGVCIGILAAAALAYGQQTTSKYARATAPPAKKTVAVESPARGSIHRIELYSGTRRSVRYLISGEVSDRDRAAARELQQAENEANYLYDLERVKQQYVSDERLLEQQRRAVQQQLYGTSVRTERDLTQGGRQFYNGGYGLGGMGGYGGFPGYGLFGGYPGYGMYGGYGGLGYGMYGGYGYRAGLTNSYNGRSRQTVTRGLQNGVGDEGRIKAALAPIIAGQASQDYADEVQNHYEQALARAASSPMLAKTLSLRKAATATVNAEPAYPEKSKVTLWVGADRYDGVVKADGASWLVLQTDDGEMRVRKSTIERCIVHGAAAPSPQRATAAK